VNKKNIFYDSCRIKIKKNILRKLITLNIQGDLMKLLSSTLALCMLTFCLAKAEEPKDKCGCNAPKPKPVQPAPQKPQRSSPTPAKPRP
jgi:hypothetical protein